MSGLDISHLFGFLTQCFILFIYFCFYLKIFHSLKMEVIHLSHRTIQTSILKFGTWIHKLNFLWGIFIFWMLILLAVYLSIRFLPLFWNFALQAYFVWEAFVLFFFFLFPFVLTPSRPVVLWFLLPSCSGLSALNLALQGSCLTVVLGIVPWLASWLDWGLHFYLLFPSWACSLLKILAPRGWLATPFSFFSFFFWGYWE